MKITANGTEYEIEADTYGYTVKSPINTVDSRNGEKKVKIHSTYHGNMRQCLMSIAERELGKCQDTIDLIATVEQLREDINNWKP